MERKDPYEVLGVERNSTIKDIKKAYRKLAKEYHPDHNKNADAEDKFKQVQDAYEILSDDAKRKAYDQYGFAGTQGYGNYSGYSGYTGSTGDPFGSTPFDMGDISDIFNTFFGGGGRGFGFDFNSAQGGSTRRSQQSVGADLRYKIKLDFMEAINGGDYKINVERDVTCEDCKGSGSATGKTKKCPVCNGAGQVRNVRNTLLGQVMMQSVCERCGGRGEVVEEPCKRCKGDGIMQEKNEVKIKIPKGAYDGMVLRYSGSGNAGKRGGSSGDLFIEISVEPHDVFERSGNDIYIDIEIEPATAVLGDTLEVPTIDGDVKFKIPPGTQSDTIFRIGGKGAPVVGKEGSRGDQYIRTKVVIPTKVDSKSKKLWQELKSS